MSDASLIACLPHRAVSRQVTTSSSSHGRSYPDDVSLYTASTSRPKCTGNTRECRGLPRYSCSSTPGWPLRAESLADGFLKTVDGKGFREDRHTRYAEETGVVQ